VQLAPQSIPDGELVTVPEPVPAVVTVSPNRGFPGAGGGGGGFAENPAVTDRAASIVTVQLPVPEHSPAQPLKDEPESGVAVSVTSVP